MVERLLHQNVVRLTTHVGWVLDLNLFWRILLSLGIGSLAFGTTLGVFCFWVGLASFLGTSSGVAQTRVAAFLAGEGCSFLFFSFLISKRAFEQLQVGVFEDDKVVFEHELWAFHQFALVESIVLVVIGDFGGQLSLAHKLRSIESHDLKKQ